MALLLPNSAFIHVPKTAGQWVAVALENAGIETEQLGPIHTSPDEVATCPRFASRSVIFTFVRDPVAWYQSMWAHRMDEEWEPIDDPDWFTQPWIDAWDEFTRVTQSDNFGTFVGKVLGAYPEGFVSRLYDRYTTGCTHVGRQETILEDIMGFLDLAGEQYDRERLAATPPRNVRGSKGWRQQAAAYSSSAAARVRSTEMDACFKYGYPFEICPHPA